MSEKFPDYFIRGISSKDFIADGQVLHTAFHFETFERDDNKQEASINWLDDDGAIDVALSQRKENGKIQFQAGVAKVNVELVKLILTNLQNNPLSYERAPIEGNTYHGNLLIDIDIPKHTKNMVLYGLALAAGTNIIPQNNI